MQFLNGVDKESVDAVTICINLPETCKKLVVKSFAKKRNWVHETYESEINFRGDCVIYMDLQCVQKGKHSKFKTKQWLIPEMALVAAS